MKKLLAIDPGDTYVGVAFFESEAENPWLSPDPDTWRCIDAQEWSPWDFADALAESLLDNDVDTVVYERFRLYADKSGEQVGSEFETAQLIGVIRYLVRIHNMHAERHDAVEAQGRMLDCEQAGRMHADPATRPTKVTLVGQMADIKKPSAGILRHLQIKSVAKPIAREHYHGRNHVVDAELHGWYYLLHGAKGRE